MKMSFDLWGATKQLDRAVFAIEIRAGPDQSWALTLSGVKVNKFYILVNSRTK